MSVKIFVSGAMAILASWMLTGCRFGNRIVRAEQAENPTGYYRSLPTRLMFTVTLQPPGGQPVVREFAGNTEYLPDDWEIFLTDPAGLAVDLIRSEGYLLGIVGDKGYKTPILVSGGGAYTLEPVAKEFVFTESPPCKQVWTMTGTGKFTQTAKTTFQDLPVRGRVALSTQGSRKYEGDCGEVLNLFRSCIEDLSKCPGSNETDQKSWQNFVLGVYGPAVLAGGVTVSEIPQIREIAYSLSYE